MAAAKSANAARVQRWYETYPDFGENCLGFGEAPHFPQAFGYAQRTADSLLKSAPHYFPPPECLRPIATPHCVPRILLVQLEFLGELRDAARDHRFGFIVAAKVA